MDNAIEERVDRSIPFLPRVEVQAVHTESLMKGMLKLSVADNLISCRYDARLARGTWAMSLLTDPNPLVFDTA